MLYYENCSSKVSVCTSGSEKNLHQLLGMNTRLKRGYTVAVFRTPPLAKAKKKKIHLVFEQNWYRRELHHSTVQKVKSTQVWKPWGMARPLPRAVSRGWELQYLSQLSCSVDSEDLNTLSLPPECAKGAHMKIVQSLQHSVTLHSQPPRLIPYKVTGMKMYLY